MDRYHSRKPGLASSRGSGLPDSGLRLSASVSIEGEERLRALWFWSLGFFALAALTGLLYRLELVRPLFEGLALGNIRHAHSHLMFFSWVTPLPLLFLTACVGRQIPRAVVPLSRWIYAILFLGAASWPFFLFFGYRSVPVGGAELPFSVILSGLVMIGWYGYVWKFLRVRAPLKSSLVLRLHEGALLMLVLSSFGAWGVAVMQFSPIDKPLLFASMTHLFLALFTLGWCLLSAMAIFCDLARRKGWIRIGTADPERWTRRIVTPVLLGAALTFPFGLSADMVSLMLLSVSRVGALLVAAGMGFFLWLLWTHRRKRDGAFLLLGGLLFASLLLLSGSLILPGSFWIGDHGLRVFWLHLLLLGLVSLTYVYAWHREYPAIHPAGRWLLSGSVLIMLILLGAAAGLLPVSVSPVLLAEVLVWSSALVVAAALVEWIAGWIAIGGRGGSSRASSSLLDKVDDMDETVEKQKYGDHSGDRSGFHHDEQSEDEHQHANRNQFEGQQESESEEPQKEGEGEGDQFREDKDHQGSENRKRRQERANPEQKENNTQSQQITADHVVEQVGPDQDQQARSNGQNAAQQSAAGGIPVNGDLYLLKHRFGIVLNGCEGKVRNAARNAYFDNRRMGWESTIHIAKLII